MDNPFKSFEIDGEKFYAFVAEDRIAMVKKFDLVQCEAALRVDGVQKTVVAAIKRRQKVLRAEAEILGERVTRRENDLISLNDMLARLDEGNIDFVRQMLCDWINELGGDHVV